MKKNLRFLLVLCGLCLGFGTNAWSEDFITQTATCSDSGTVSCKICDPTVSGLTGCTPSCSSAGCSYSDTYGVYTDYAYLKNLTSTKHTYCTNNQYLAT